jgi:hypothetical protein
MSQEINAGQSQPPRPTPPADLVALLIIACFLYLLMIWIFYQGYQLSARLKIHPDPESYEGLGLLEAAVIAFPALWFVLALMLLVGGIKGEMPRWAAVLAVFLVPFSWFGACMTLIGNHVLVLIVPALLPPLIASYAIWARLPRFHAALPPQPTSLAACTLIFILSVAPFFGDHPLIIGGWKIGGWGWKIGSFFATSGPATWLPQKEPEKAAAAMAAAPGWIGASNGAVPSGAVEGGKEAAPGQAILFICRAPFNGGIYPGKVRQDFGSCRITFAGAAKGMATYQVLTTVDLSWVAAQDGGLPANAYEAGKESPPNDEKLYVCRAPYNGGIHPGRLNPASKGCNIEWGGKEIIIYTYEVLIAKGHKWF